MTGTMSLSSSNRKSNNRKLALPLLGVVAFTAYIAIIPTVLPNNNQLNDFSINAPSTNDGNPSSSIRSNSRGSSSNSTLSWQEEIHPPLPSCKELMQHPHSPYADGSFLTRRSTHVAWNLRHDHSRELVLPSTCVLERYSSSDAKMCLRNKHVMFVGDSLTRYQYLSLAHFLEYDIWPKRFNVGGGSSSGGPCRRIDEDGNDACSTREEPNVCSEGDWPSWPAYLRSLGGGTTVGSFVGGWSLIPRGTARTRVRICSTSQRKHR